MRLVTLLVVIILSLAPAHAAHAAGGGGGADDDIVELFEIFGLTADGVPTLAFSIADISGPRGVAYGYSELAYNTIAGSVYTHILMAGVDPSSFAIAATGDAVHTALLAHGIVTIAEHRSWPISTSLVVAGSLLSTEMFYPLIGSDGDPDAAPPSRAYVIAATAVNTPLTLGYTYRAYRDFRTGHDGLGALNVTGALFAATFAGNAIDQRLHLHPHLHGVAPTVVDDGVGDLALGLGVHGRL